MKKCFENMDLEWISNLFRIVSHPNRLQIICIINKKWEVSVSEIIEILWLKPSLVSHHLNLLKNLRIISSKRDGKNILYSINKIEYMWLKDDIKNIFKL